ncbi:MAG TPA: GNAT family N-acetyltransferase [Thermomicrobiales bacterium]|jgi:GNAT superfamily N-acetyltransferase
MHLDLKAVADLTAAEQDARRALTLAVYPPGAPPTAGEELTWAAPQWAVMAWEGDRLVAHVGIVVRDATLDGRDVRIGGIGSVKTHPAARGRGYAGRAIGRAAEFFAADPALAFALLVCREPLVPFYGKLGWQPFGGTLLVEQPGGTVPFTANEVMTLPVHANAPQTGTLDLRGLPW